GVRHDGPVRPQNLPDLLAAARSRADALVEGVRTLVEVESPSSDPAACQRCVSTAADLAQAWLGTPATVREHRGRAVLQWGPARPRILLLGHLDTVWPIGTLERIPWQVEGDRMRGPGIFDMKVGVIQALGALALLEADQDDGVGVLLTTDEEIGSLASRDIIEETARDAAAVLVLEPSIDGDLKSARKGTSWYVVEITGRAAHAGLDPEKGINALVEAAALIRDCVTWADPALGTTVTPTTARAGVTENTVPDKAVVGIDVRAWSSEEQERIDRLMSEWRPSHPEATAIIVSGGINRPAMEEFAGRALAELAASCAAGLGLAPIGARAVGGASDGNFTAALGVPTLDGMGAVGDGAHADHEWASVSALPERTALVAAIVAALHDGAAT
ncbi:MAG: M20/M25/M40 family metallo-hydrolase, partial [Candidatus Nanopelagicales bacterium]